MKHIPFLFLLLLLFTFNACKDDTGGGTTSCGGDFDQSAMFQNIADNLILPEYSNLKTKVDDMVAKTETFTTTYDVATLESLRNAYIAAYTSWQHTAQYNFGPAEEVFLRSSVNNFPLDVAMTETNIQTRTYDFNQPDNYDKGFPAMDYLLYGIAEDDNAIVLRYVTDNTANYEAYLKAVVLDIQERVNHTVNAWTSGYDETFINNTGTAAGSSLSLIINQLNANYELIKREKLGIPSGVLTLGFPNTDRVEAFYSGHSQVLLEASLQASQALYLGGNGLGLDDYLTHVKAQKNDEPLDNLIKQQFTSAIEAIDVIDSPLSAFIESNPTAVENAYNEVTKQVVNIKTDLPSVLCVSITYIDNPSDSD
ncbi:MAG: imelysin family protein [Chitinophagales bacterium]